MLWCSRGRWDESTENRRRTGTQSCCCNLWTRTHCATFYLIASQTVDRTTDVVQLVVNRRAIMFSPAELNHIFTCFFQLPHAVITTPLLAPSGLLSFFSVVLVPLFNGLIYARNVWIKNTFLKSKKVFHFEKATRKLKRYILFYIRDVGIECPFFLQRDFSWYIRFP